MSEKIKRDFRKYYPEKQYIIGNDFLDYFLWRFNQKRKEKTNFGLTDFERTEFVEKEMKIALKRKKWGKIEEYNEQQTNIT